VAVVAGNGREGLLLHAAAIVAAAVCGDQVSRVSAAGRWGFSRSSPRPWRQLGHLAPTLVSDPDSPHTPSPRSPHARNTRTSWHPWRRTHHA
jgi:hypothetical protein